MLAVLAIGQVSQTVSRGRGVDVKNAVNIAVLIGDRTGTFGPVEPVKLRQAIGDHLERHRAAGNVTVNVHVIHAEGCNVHVGVTGPDRIGAHNLGSVITV